MAETDGYRAYVQVPPEAAERVRNDGKNSLMNEIERHAVGEEMFLDDVSDADCTSTASAAAVRSEGPAGTVIHYSQLASLLRRESSTRNGRTPLLSFARGYGCRLVLLRRRSRATGSQSDAEYESRMRSLRLLHEERDYARMIHDIRGGITEPSNIARHSPDGRSGMMMPEGGSFRAVTSHLGLGMHLLLLAISSLVLGFVLGQRFINISGDERSVYRVHGTWEWSDMNENVPGGCVGALVLFCICMLVEVLLVAAKEHGAEMRAAMKAEGEKQKLARRSARLAGREDVPLDPREKKDQ